MTTLDNVDYKTSMEQIYYLIKSRSPYVWVVTHEESRFIKTLNIEIAEKQQKELWIWSSYQGLLRYDPMMRITKASGDMKGTNNPQVAFEKIAEYQHSNKDKGSIWIFKDFHMVLQGQLARQMRDLRHHFIQDTKNIVIVSPMIAHTGGAKPGLEPTLDKQVAIVNYELPDREAIEEHVSVSLAHLNARYKNKNCSTKLNYSKQEIELFVSALQGLTEQEIQSAISKSLCHLKRIDEKKLLLEKKQIIARSDILEYINQKPNMDQVGGLDAAKKYIETYSNQFSKEAIEFGVEPLRGLLLTGIAGNGKSLLAKCIASTWNLPLLRLDVGKVMGSLVGQSIRGCEEIIWYDENFNARRNTMKELVELAPSCCWVHTYTDTGKATLRQVKEFIAHKLAPETKLYKLTMEDGRSIGTTGDHGVLAPTDTLAMKEVRVDSLQPGDFLAMPGHLPNQIDRDNQETWLDGFLAGAWLGDGDYNAKDVRLYLNEKDCESFGAILDEAKLNYSIYNSSSSEHGRVVHIRNNLRAKLEAQGYVGNSHTKRVPAQVFAFSDDYIRGLLSGYFSTDGSFSGHVIESSSVSKNLRDDIVHLLHRVGIHAFITEKTEIRGFRTEEGTDYYIHISAETDLVKFENTIGFVQDYKTEALAQRKMAEPYSYYIPLTNQIKNELCAMRRQMWKKLHVRPLNFKVNATSIGLNTIKKYANFAMPSWDCNPNNLSTDHYGRTLHNALQQDIRWIQVRSVEEIERDPSEDIVYDISIPDLGVEKFIAGSCPVLVHNSEQRMREVCATAAAVAPCLLWCDEVEKALSGTKSSNNSDGGTLSRVFGTLLTAMEESMPGVVFIATANDISALPPEFIRRFNEVMFVDLPVPEERQEIFEIHLKKRGRDIKKLNLDMKELLAATHLFTGSEIEKAVKEGIARAFNQKHQDITQEDLLGAIKDTKCIAKVMKDQIDKLREWARDKARYASSLAAEAAAPGNQKITTSSGKELDLKSDLDELDAVIETSKEKKAKKFKESGGDFAQLDGLLDD